MFVQEKPAGTFSEINLATWGAIVASDGVSYPLQVLDVWSSEALAQINIYHVNLFVPPAGYQVAGQPEYIRDGNVVNQVYYDLQPIVIPVPQEITRRQLIIALLATGYISADEAKAAATTGAVPSFIKGYFDQMDPESQTLAYITFASMSVCERQNPILLAMMTLTGLTSSQMDDYFRWAVTL